MRTHLEFRSTAFPLESASGTQPSGEAVARFLAEQLPLHGVDVTGVLPEDWGWVVQIANEAFPLWIGCGHYQEYPDGYLCFIEPSKPKIRRRFRRILTEARVAQVADVLETVIRGSGKAYAFRWWTDEEVARG